VTLIHPKAFFDTVRPELFHGFTSQSQIDGLNTLLDVWSGVDIRIVAYGLATAWWETDFTMQPVRECGRGYGHPYGRPTGPYKQVYYGRGYVQMTWLNPNYQRADNALRADGTLKPGESLVKDPDLALRPDLAARIMRRGMLEGWFGPPIGDFFTATKTDFFNARRNINVLDHAADLAHAAVVFRDALMAGGYDALGV
jgi:hypothetical protein